MLKNGKWCTIRVIVVKGAMWELMNYPSKLPTHHPLCFSLIYISVCSCCSKTLQCCTELAPLCWNPGFICLMQEGRCLKSADLIYVTWFVNLHVFTRVMVSESSLCNSRSHDWLHKTYWQIPPTHAEIFQRNNHTWCQRKQLITVNIYVCLHNVMTSGHCCSSY